MLGSFGLTLNGDSVRLPMTAQRLLAFLALQDRPLLRAHVAGSLWPDTTERRAGANLRSTLWRLGEACPALLTVEGASLELAPSVEVDVRHGIALTRRLLARPPSQMEAEAPEVLFRDILPDWSDDWVILEREHYRQLRLHALESLCAQMTTLGKFPEAVEAGLAAVAAEPLRESAHRTLIAAHIAEGNRGEAARQYGLFRRLLREELGLDPSDLMKELVRGLRHVAVLGFAVAAGLLANGADVHVTMG